MMPAETEKKEIAKMLQAKINAMQGLGKLPGGQAQTGLSPFASAFPGNVFPTGAIHEFVSHTPSDAASTNGFITALAGKLIKNNGLCLWIGREKNIYPPGLVSFGLMPDHIIFIHAPRQQEALWIIEEALKCDSLTAVIGEINELGFTESRRLQLVAEGSGVTAFIHRFCPRANNAMACTSRWKIHPSPSMAEDGLPGIGHFSWDVELLKVRNGRPNSWHVSWSNNGFIQIDDRQSQIQQAHERRTG